MDPRQLQTFLTLCKIKNYTKTAESLGYAQSSVTAQIRQLESELGIRLFDILGKKVTLTSYGEMLVPYASQILTLEQEIKSRMNFHAESSGHIHIGASESLCIFQLPALIRRFRQEYPQVSLHLQLMDQEHVVQQLCDNSIDMALTIGNSMEHPALNCLYQKKEPILILAAPTHLLAAKNTLTAKDFSDQPFILTGPGCDYRNRFLQDMHSQDVSFPILLETGSIQALKEMAISGLGLCVLPALSVKKELECRELVSLPYPTDYPIYSQLFSHKAKWMSPCLTAFTDLIQHPITAPDP